MRPLHACMLCLAVALFAAPAARADWPMAGANPERTSWTAEEVRGPLLPLWAHPIDPYISQKVQLVAVGDLIYVSTARGLYALDAATGAERWVYRTELPLGHSPTVAGGAAYVGCFDRRLHAVDAATGRGLWTFEAGAGFSTSPLVVEGRVFAGCRDGFFYALDAKTGGLAWKFEVGAPILYSAACKDGAVFFAAEDGRAYALDARTGKQVWRSAKLPGAGFHSWWPVVCGDRVIFAGSSGHRAAIRPGPPQLTTTLELPDVYPDYKTAPQATPVGPVGKEPGAWAAGTPTVDASRILDYFKQKPWRRNTFVLDRATGQERETAPFLWCGTHSGNRYPPVVGGDGVLYVQNNYLSSQYIAGGGPSGWKFGTPFISALCGGWKAVDEPMALSAGGRLLYWTLCCNRSAGAVDITIANPAAPPGRASAGRQWEYYGYNINKRFPELCSKAWLFACSVHNDQNPPVPHRGRVYMHRYNAVLAFSADGRMPEVPAKDEPAPDRLRAELVESAARTPGLMIAIDAADGRWPAVTHTHDYLANPRRRTPNAEVLFRIAAGDAGAPDSVKAEPGAGPGGKATADAGGKTLALQMFERFPGVLAETAAHTVRVAGAFTGAAWPEAGSVKTAADAATIRGADLAEGWILLWAGGDIPKLTPFFALNGAEEVDKWQSDWLRAGMKRFRPVLIVLEKRPETVALSEAGLRIAFPGPAGAIVAVPLYGLSSADPRQALAWAKGLPAEVAARCRTLNRAARALPAEVRDEWTIDPATGDATVTTICRSRIIADAWGGKPEPRAYLPPALALAAWNGSPIRVAGSPVDLDYAVPLGRLASVGGDKAVAVLPGLAKYWREGTLGTMRGGSARDRVGAEHPPYVPPRGAANDALRTKLAAEIEKMLAAGHLRPGYLSSGICNSRFHKVVADDAIDYFHNPADTISTLLTVLPLLPEDLRKRTEEYVRKEFEAWPPYAISHIGWKDGAAREDFDLPPETDADRAAMPPQNETGFPGWKFPPQNFYAIALYAERFGGAKELFEKCRARLENPRFPVSMPFVLNSYIAGYIGYVRLARAAEADVAAAEKELARMLVLRAALAKDPESGARAGFEYGGHFATLNRFDPSRGEAEYAHVRLGGWPLYNFTLLHTALVPELGRFLGDYAGRESAAAVAAYEQRNPYWFAAAAEDGAGENVIQPLYDVESNFQARAMILRQPQAELVKYLDVPYFVRGDLFYIRNLAAALEAP